MVVDTEGSLVVDSKIKLVNKGKCQVTLIGADGCVFGSVPKGGSLIVDVAGEYTFECIGEGCCECKDCAISAYDIVGEASAPVVIDSSCEDPVHVNLCPLEDPLPVEITNQQPVPQKVVYCNEDTDTHWIKVCVYTFTDPANPLTIVETIISEADTGVPCAEPIDQADVDYQTTCNTDTGTTFIRSVMNTIIDGTPVETVLSDWSDTGLPCVKEDCPQWVWYPACDADTNTPIRWAEGLDCDGDIVYPGGATEKVYYYKQPTDQLPVSCTCIGLFQNATAQTTIDATILGNTISVDGGSYSVATNQFISGLNSGLVTTITFDDGAGNEITWTGSGTPTVTTSGTATNITIAPAAPRADGCDDEVAEFIADNPSVEGSVSNTAVGFHVSYEGVNYVCLTPDVSPYDYNNPISPQPTNVVCEPCPDTSPVYNLDYECNSETGNYDEIVSELINGLPTAQIVEDTGLECGTHSVSVNETCRTDTGTIWQTVTVTDENGVEVSNVSIDTLEECEKSETTIQCMKDKFIEGGVDNTFTNYTHTNQTFKTTFSNGDIDTFNVSSATGWTDQVDQMSTGLGSIMPWAQTVDPFCNIQPNGCGGLQAPFVELNKMYARYVGFRVCPSDKVPVSIQYTSDQSATPVELVIQYVETPTIYIDRCVSCDGEESFKVDGVDYTPVCPIPCSESFPEVPLAACSITYLDGCDNVNQDIVSNFIPIVRAITDCGSGPKVTYLQEDADGALVNYPLVGTFVDCATGEPIPEPEEPCEVSWDWVHGHVDNYNNTGECLPLRWLEGIDCLGEPVLKTPHEYYPCSVDPKPECVCISFSALAVGVRQTYNATVSAGNTSTVVTTTAAVITQLNTFVNLINAGQTRFLKLGDTVISGYGTATITGTGTTADPFIVKVNQADLGDGCDDERAITLATPTYTWVDGTASDDGFSSGGANHICLSPTTPEPSITPLDPQPRPGSVVCGSCPIEAEATPDEQVVGLMCYNVPVTDTFDFTQMNAQPGGTFATQIGDSQVTVTAEDTGFALSSTNSTVLISQVGTANSSKNFEITSPCPFSFRIENVQGIIAESLGQTESARGITPAPDSIVVDPSMNWNPTTGDLTPTTVASPSDGATFTYNAGTTVKFTFSAPGYPAASQVLRDLEAACMEKHTAVGKMDCETGIIAWTDIVTGDRVDASELFDCADGCCDEEVEQPNNPIVQIVPACDIVADPVTGAESSVQDIDIRYTFVDGQPPTIEYFLRGTVTSYTLQGFAGDCVTLAPILPPEPDPLCKQYSATREYATELEELIDLSLTSGAPAPDQSSTQQIDCFGDVVLGYSGGGEVYSWSSATQLGVRNTTSISSDISFDIPEGATFKVDLTNINGGTFEWWEVSTAPSETDIAADHAFDGTTLTGPGNNASAVSTLTFEGGQVVTISAGSLSATGWTQIMRNARLCKKGCSTAGLWCNPDTGQSAWYNVLTGLEVSECDMEPCCCDEGSVPNTHMIEGCVNDEASFTVIDDEGNALFAPKPLTSLGFD